MIDHWLFQKIETDESVKKEEAQNTETTGDELEDAAERHKTAASHKHCKISKILINSTLTKITSHKTFFFIFSVTISSFCEATFCFGLRLTLCMGYKARVNVPSPVLELLARNGPSESTLAIRPRRPDKKYYSLDSREPILMRILTICIIHRHFCAIDSHVPISCNMIIILNSSLLN